MMIRNSEGEEKMGIIKAAASAVGGALADQWLETIEPAKLTTAS